MDPGFHDGRAFPDATGRLRVLVVNSVLAAPDRDSGALRLYRIVEALVQDGHDVTFIARDGYRREPETARLSALGVDTYPLDHTRMADLGVHLPGTPFNFERILANGHFDVALLSFFHVAEQYLPLIRAASPLTRIVVDTVDVHHVRERRGAQLRGDSPALVAAEHTRQREQAIYGAADAVIAVSERDADELAELVPSVPRFVVSNIHAPVGPTPPFSERSGIVFVGSFPHLPNVDAVLDFHRSVWPLVQRQLPDVSLTIVGTNPPPAVAGLRSRDVTVTGWVPEVGPYLDRARVSIAPLRYGAGVKGKIGEALGRGLPVVTTGVGAEGMALADEANALVADAPEAFARAVARLHTDPALWERLSANGRAHIEARLGTAAARQAIRQMLAGVAVTPFVVRADGPGLEQAVSAYVSGFAPDDRTSLVLTVDPGDPAAPQSAFERASAAIGAAGLSADDVADIQIASGGPSLVFPSRAVVVDDAGLTGALSATAPVEQWRARASQARVPRPKRPTLIATLVIHANDDAEALSAQLQAVRRADLPADVELIVAADAAGGAVQEVLDGLRDVRVIRGSVPLGRHQAWQLAAQNSTARYVIALAPLALPGPGFVQALIRRLAEGAALAAPRVAGAWGLRLGPDGSLWAREREDHGELDALPYDCLGAPRELMASGVPLFPRGEGLVEHQLAAWAAARGGLALAGEASVQRMPAAAASVLVCTRNRAEELPDGIALLLQAGARDIVIVDNASTDATPEVAAELAARSAGIVRVVHEPRGGLCHARNAAAAAARHDLLIYVDDDARPAPGWLNHISRTLMRPGVVNAGGPISALWPTRRTPGWPGRDCEPYLSVLDLDDVERRLAPPYWVYGANWAIRRSALDAVGGFDPEFGPGPEARINGDEVSVAGLLHARGLGATIYSPGAAVGHRISPDRVDDRFLLTRALCAGIERPRHARTLGRRDDELLQDAVDAARRLFDTVPLAGNLTVAAALDRVHEQPIELSRRVDAAAAIGVVAGTTAMLGEDEAELGDLRLQIDPEPLLRGVVTDAVPA